MNSTRLNGHESERPGLAMNDLDRDFSGKRGAWEPHSALIDFCEPNYVYTPYVAEVFNTLSAALMVCIGGFVFFRLLPRSARRSWNTRIIWGSFCLQGVGSVGLHASLHRGWQKLDELPMMICALACLYPLAGDFDFNRANAGISSENQGLRDSTEPKGSPLGVSTRQRRNASLLAGICAAGAALFVVYEVFEYFVAFHLLFTPIEFYSLGRLGYLCHAHRDSRPDFARLGGLGLATYGTAICFWVAEMVACPWVRSLHTHAWAWHLLAACGFQLLGLAMELRRDPEKRYLRLVPIFQVLALSSPPLSSEGVEKASKDPGAFGVCIPVVCDRGEETGGPRAARMNEKTE